MIDDVIHTSVFTPHIHRRHGIKLRFAMCSEPIKKTHPTTIVIVGSFKMESNDPFAFECTVTAKSRTIIVVKFASQLKCTTYVIFRQLKEVILAFTINPRRNFSFFHIEFLLIYRHWAFGFQSWKY